MPVAKQLTGARFGRLTVIRKLGSRSGRATWECRCACGKFTTVISHALTSGHTKSCGCWKEERNRSTKIKHGHAMRGKGLSTTYRTWQAMMTRCYNVKSKSFKDYGGRGVTVYPGWHYFENFLAYMGRRPEGKTLDRLNVNGNYEPGNCTWSTRTEQNRNTRANRMLTFDGALMTQAEFCNLIGLKQSTVSYRIRHGWTPEQIAATPPHNGNRITSKLGDEVEISEELI